MWGSAPPVSAPSQAKQRAPTQGHPCKRKGGRSWKRFDNLDHLADMLSAIAEGGIIVSKVIKDKRALSQQLMLYREFIRAVFLGT
jgi:hypothetical protein